MLIKTMPMSASPKLKYEIELIINQLEKKGYATTNDKPAFRYLSCKLRDVRDKKMLWFTTGCAIEQKNGIKHVIQVNPDFKFERVNGMSFKLTYRF